MLEWLTWGRRYRRWADSTCDGYRRRVTAWLAWCEANRIRPCDADAKHVNAWLDTLHPTAAVRTHGHTALLAWFDWQVHTGVCNRNPVRDIPRLPSRRVVPRSLPPDDVSAVLKAAIEHGTRWGAYVGFLAYGGLRRAEACRLRWIDLEGSDAWIRVDGKGGHERMLPIHAKLRPLILRWRSEYADPQWMFPGRSGPMSVATATKHSRQILDAAGVTEATPHWLRHSFGRRMVEQGVPVPDVMGALGHSSLSSTTIYTRSRPGNVAAAVAMLDY